MSVFRFLAILLGSLWAHLASAQELRVLTSFPPDLSTAYTRMWAERAADAEIRVLNKNTVAAIEEVLRGNSRGFDIFWASSPEAFELLQRRGAFADTGLCGPDGPHTVAPFALSSVGWARRSDSRLFMPTNWNDLLRPLYRDKIAMARPARSGSAHMLVERMLMVRGWEDGWRYLLELSGNLSTLTARSYGVPDGLINERFEIGLTIDFLSEAKSDMLDFRYGRPIVLAAAQVGILKGGKAPMRACDFLRMLLSRDGQAALMAPGISRIPFDPLVREEMVADLPEDIVEALKLAWLEYDAEQSSNRYWAVNTLFDLMITDRLVERRNLWRRYHALQGTLPPDALSSVRALLTETPVTGEEALDASLTLYDGAQTVSRRDAVRLERDLLRDWNTRVAQTMARADAALNLLERRVEE
ncbi:ABC transporter substrate-binding protein [Sedimentitalea sp. XS_ASV28]|uniref:ABC transporter substrate-binding protein n=1 Tax=Sedimentitalea sp. XS_ASV28 TaxID=3241296 RepID=UPI0035168A5E